MVRILAKTIGGPLDGNYFSVVEDQMTIEGMNHMPDGSLYRKREDTLRDLEKEEKGLTDLLFDPDSHNLNQIALFDYVES